MAELPKGLKAGDWVCIKGVVTATDDGFLRLNDGYYLSTLHHVAGVEKAHSITVIDPPMPEEPQHFGARAMVRVLGMDPDEDKVLAIRICFGMGTNAWVVDGGLTYYSWQDFYDIEVLS